MYEFVRSWGFVWVLPWDNKRVILYLQSQTLKQSSIWFQYVVSEPHNWNDGGSYGCYDKTKGDMIIFDKMPYTKFYKLHCMGNQDENSLEGTQGVGYNRDRRRKWRKKKHGLSLIGTIHTWVACSASRRTGHSKEGLRCYQNKAYGCW